MPPRAADKITHAILFPHESSVARYIVSLTMARQDIYHTAIAAVQLAREDDADVMYYLRLTTAHLHEALVALRRYEEEFEEVRQFEARLPEAARKSLKEARRRGHEADKALKHGRQHTFHYPHPAPPRKRQRNSDRLLRDYLERVADTPVTWNVRGIRFREVTVAQMAAHSLAAGRTYDGSAIESEAALAGAFAFYDFAGAAYDGYMQQRIDGKV